MRRWFQFRLRTAFVAMTLASLPLGWIGGQFREWQADQQALLGLQASSVDFETAYLQPRSTPKFLVFL